MKNSKEKTLEKTQTKKKTTHSSELDRRVHRRLHLRRGVREHRRVRARRRAVRVPRVLEQLRRAPQHFFPGLLLQVLGELDDRREVGVGLLERAALGRDVAVVEGPEVDAELVEELEHRSHAPVRDLELREARVLPGPRARRPSERVAAVAAQRVPERDGEAEPLAHGLARDDLVGVVVAERERVLRVGALVLDLFHAGEELGLVGQVAPGGRALVRFGRGGLGGGEGGQRGAGEGLGRERGKRGGGEGRERDRRGCVSA